MDESRACIACGAALAGPFQPEITLTLASPVDESDEKPPTLTAQAWTCLGCGLVHWYAEDDDLEDLLASVLTEEAPTGEPDESYKRRRQVLRMMQRVRRM
ncbi:MAG: hypothetical protein PVH17_08455 [Anaerolineae bacterium]